MINFRKSSDKGTGLFNKKTLEFSDYCGNCNIYYQKSILIKSYFCCPVCGKHLHINPSVRIELILDRNSFIPLETLTANRKNLLNSIEFGCSCVHAGVAVIAGGGRINDIFLITVFMDYRFRNGNIGQEIGEKVTRAIEEAIFLEAPLIIFYCSWGYKLKEGIISLVQMAKMSGALKRHSKKGLLSISVLTNPTVGGVAAGFAMLGDIILSEPEALIGFTDTRVTEQTVHKRIPEEFQTAEYVMEKGFIDMIVDRKILRETLSKLLHLHI